MDNEELSKVLVDMVNDGMKVEISGGSELEVSVDYYLMKLYDNSRR